MQVPENLIRLLRGLRFVFQRRLARRRGPDAGCFILDIIQPSGRTAAGNQRFGPSLVMMAGSFTQATGLEADDLQWAVRWEEFTDRPRSELQRGDDGVS
ncbi:hypothetical protein MRX96_032010 [Rhipicephalus microplus]